MIEPTIKAMLSEYLHDWQGIESMVRRLVLRHLGALKDVKMFLVDFDERYPEESSDFLDLGKFDEFMRSYPRFPHRVDYLQKNDIISENLSILLKELNTRRNKIHRYKTDLPEPLRAIFSIIHNFLTVKQIAISDPGFPDTNKESEEAYAGRILNLLKESDKTGTLGTLW